MKKPILLATAAALAMTPALAQQTQQADETEQNQSSQAQSESSAAAGAEMSAEDFVAKAGMGDLFEIETAQMAEERAQSDEVRQFAQTLITDHAQAAQKLADAASEADVTVAVVNRLQMELDSTDVSEAGSGTDIQTEGSAARSTEQDSAAASDVDGEASPSGAGTGTAASETHVDAGRTAMLDPEHQEKINELRNAPEDEFDRRFLEIQIQAHQDAIEAFEQYSERGDEDALQQHAEQTLPALREHLETAQSLAEDLG